MEELLTKGDIPTFQPSQGMLFYLAGLIDGEGTILVEFENRNESYHFVPKVQITNTSFKLLHTIQEVFGGKLNLGTKSSTKWKQGYTLCWRGLDAIKLLKMLDGKFLLKDIHCKLLKDFPINKEGGKSRLLPEEVLLRRKIHLALKMLNKKGPKNGK